MLAYMESSLLEYPEFFSDVDSAVIGEGEQAVIELCENLNGGRFETVPNLVYREAGGTVQKSEHCHQEDVNALPTPDFGGLDLTLYLFGHRVLPLLTARGCSWDRCAFCSACSTYGHRYRPRKLDLVMEDIRTLMEYHDCHYFTINDETVPPARLEMFSRKILDCGLHILFSVLARFEAGFTAARLEKAFEAGCRWISWGLESSASRVLQLMDKGISPAVCETVLANSSQAGIWNNLYVMFGFPTETREEAGETMQFISDHEQHIDSVFFDVFRLEGQSKVWRNPSFYAVEVADTPRGFFGPCYEYTVSSGLNRTEIMGVFEAFNRSSANSHFNRFNYLGLSTIRLLVLCDIMGRQALRRYILKSISKRLGRTRASQRLQGLTLRSAEKLESAPIGAVGVNEEPSAGTLFAVLNRATGIYLITNATGMELLKLLEKEQTYDELLKVCEERFEVSSARLHQDIARFIEPMIIHLHVEFRRRTPESSRSEK